MRKKDLLKACETAFLDEDDKFDLELRKHGRVHSGIWTLRRQHILPPYAKVTDCIINMCKGAEISCSEGNYIGYSYFYYGDQG